MNNENESRLRNIQTIVAGQNIKERDYWLSKLSGEPEKTAFPYDTIKEDGGAVSEYTFQLTGAVYDSLMKISNKSDVRLHILFVAGWLIQLNRYTGNTDIIVGVPTYKQEVEGELINTALALRNTVTGKMTVKELLLQVGQTILEANQNQNYPIETLLYKLNLPGSGSHEEFQLFELSILLEGIHERSYLNRIKQNMIVSFRKTGESIEGIMEYKSQLYRETTICRIVAHYVEVMRSALSDVNRPISQVELLSEEERKRIQEDFNNNAAEFPHDKLVYQFIEDHASNAPEQVAVRAIHEPPQQITTKELNEQSNRVAWELVEKGVQPGDIVGIMMERSIEMVIGILGIWKAGGAYIPIDPGNPQERIDYMLKDSGAKILVGGHLPPAAKNLFEKRFLDFQKLLINDMFFEGDVGDRHACPGYLPSNSLSYIIYTSGTTGKPKGAMVEHIGMMNHIWAKINTLGITEKSVVVQNASHTFDISVWQFFTALVKGGTTVIYPEELVLDPSKFIDRIIEDRVTIFEVVPSYLSVLLDAVGTRRSLPLNYLLVTGEEVKPTLVARWFKQFPGIKMVNAYGPTEASDDITHFVMESAPEMERIPLGKPVQNFDIYIVDENMNLCPVGVQGELCVRGIGVGRGYINRPELTAERFIMPSATKNPFEKVFLDRPKAFVNTLYKTGDLAKWLPDGNIEFLGRIDYQVKIRGFRIELGEIENSLARIEGVKDVVVIDREDREGKKYLCAYLTGKEGKGKIPGVVALKESLSKALPEYMIPTNFISMETLPLTSNGKIDRKALPEPTAPIRDIPYISEEMLKRLQMETKAEKVAEKVELPAPTETQVAELTEGDRRRILYEFNNTEAEYPNDKTLNRLFEEQVEKTPGNTAVAGLSAQITYRELNEKANRLALRLRDLGIGPGNIVGMMGERTIEVIIGIMAIFKAGAAYMTIASTYPEKRIEYMLRDSETKYILNDSFREIKGMDSMIINLGDRQNYIGEGSNLPAINTSRDPVAIFYTSGSTGQPKGVIVEHRGVVNRLWWMNTLYPLKETDVILHKTPTIFDVSMWELFGWMFGGASLYLMPALEGEKPEDIVAATIKGNVTHIHIPPAFQLIFLNYIESTGKANELSRLKRVFASGEALLPAHVNAFNRVLYKRNGTRLYNLYGPTEASIEVSYFDCTSDEPVEIVPIGKPIHNIQLVIVDSSLRLAPVGIVGELCIAGVGLARGYLNRPERTAESFVLPSATKNPFEKGFLDLPKLLLKELTLNTLYKTGDLARWMPDGNIEFLGRIDQQVQLNGIRIELGEIESALLKHKDIKEAAVIDLKDTTKNMQYLCAYVNVIGDSTKSDYKEFLARELPHFMLPTRYVELDRMPLTPSGKIDRKALREMRKNVAREEINWESESGDEQEIRLSEEEKKRVLYDFNETDAPYSKDKTLGWLFEEQVERTPDHIAVFDQSTKITYRELNEKSNKLAMRLIEKGVRPEDIVGVMVTRSIVMITAIFAVLKAGGAYMAISLTYPDKRIDFISRDSGIQVVLTDNLRKYPETGMNPVSIDVTDEQNYTGNGGNPTIEITSGSAAAVFYTSGSTGNPKGAVLEHAGLVNRLHWMQRAYPLVETDVILQKTAVIFDVSMWELFWWSQTGASLYLMPPGQGDKPQDLADAIKTGGVTVTHFIPTPLTPFLHLIETTGQEKNVATLKRVFASGEALTPSLVDKFNRLLYAANGTRLHNLYGPTEASIDVTYFDCPPDSKLEIIPIGKPIDNVRLYIVDHNLQPTPIGIAGQLLISGVALARGYLNCPEKTAESFILPSATKNPFEKGFLDCQGRHPLPKFLLKELTLNTNTLYKTGDLACWAPDGNIEFLGRIDQQLKINGIRIELGEIESGLLKHSDIKEAVVIPRADEKGELYLCAFVVAAQDLGGSDFREALIRELPYFMIPAQYVELEKLPLTPSGKVDRKTLGLIEIETSREVEYIAPRTEIETRIVEIWKGILNTDKVGINDNFFDLGGNSLGIIQVNLKLKEEFKHDIPALVMFEYSTVSALAQYLEKTFLSPSAAPGEEEIMDTGEEERTEAKARGKNKMRERRDKVRKGRAETGNEE